MYTLEKFHQLVQSHMDKCFHCNSFKILMVITEISINRKMDKILYTHAMEYYLAVKMKQLDLHVST